MLEDRLGLKVVYRCSTHVPEEAHESKCFYAESNEGVAEQDDQQDACKEEN